MREGLNITSLSSPIGRYKLIKKLGSGIFGEVFKATDSQAADKAVAVKVQIHFEDDDAHIHEEYKILRDFTSHPNLIDFYGVFCEKSESLRKIWFILELCDCGTVMDIVRKLKATDRKMSEEHIAYILKYTIKAVCYLHENKIIHRNIRCSNILITKDGEVKLIDFALSCKLSGNAEKTRTNIGSPSWMAPEVVAVSEDGYDNRIDVWALGITTIEMVDGKGPFQDMHPTRAMFQILRNPPPSVCKPSMSSNEINDFIAECLEKNPEHRPYMMELVEHPFIQLVPENDYHLSTELKMLAVDLNNTPAPEKIPERIIKNGLLTTEGVHEPETMQVEDLAALDILTEDNLMSELYTKLAKGSFTSFIGDVLLILNPNMHADIYNENYHKKYECKSRSDNEPHIFGVADGAYQDAMHHNEPQHIVFSGESKSGKTTSMFHALSHLTYLGAMKNNTAERIQKANDVIQACISAATPINPNSTRGILQVQVTYGSSGKLSGAIFWLYQLEKWRVSSTDMTQANFNLLYYFYDAMEAENRLEELCLEKYRKHRYLRILEEPPRGVRGVRETPSENVAKYKECVEHLKILDWEQEDITFFETVLAAILVIGNVRFKDSRNGTAEIENPEEAKKVAKLLSLDEVKFLWALLNYCLIEKGTAIKKRHTTDEARDARDTLASALYKSGDKYSVSLLDMFGFECFHRNRLEQLIVNTTNEQIQFLYNQRIFAWEMQEEEQEGIEVAPLHYYDNKSSVDQLMARPAGIFYLLDEASRNGSGQEFIMNAIRTSSKGPYVKLSGSHEFSVAHYTGKVNYDAREMADKNKDFLPPEMIETMRASRNATLQQLFKNKLTKTGNLTIVSTQSKPQAARSKNEKEMENLKARKYNTVSRGHYSQSHRMRTAAATYRATSLEILKQLSIGPGSGGTHYVRCVRADLTDTPRGFQGEVVRQQLRALAILDTAKARQKGFSCRIPFAEFIRRISSIRKSMLHVSSSAHYTSPLRGSEPTPIKELKKQQSKNISEDEAALAIQKAYRGYMVRKAYGPLVNKTSDQIDEETATFLKRYAMKWKSRSIFQVLLQYRAMKYQDLVHFSQQIHIYNQALVEGLVTTNTSVPLDKIDPNAKEITYLGSVRPTVWKLPFRIDQLQFFDTSAMCDPTVKSTDTLATPNDSDHEQWDEPLKRGYSTQTDPYMLSASTQTLITMPFCRDPMQPLPKLPSEDTLARSMAHDVYVGTGSRPVVYKKKMNLSPQGYYQPPTPWASPRDDTDILENTSSSMRRSNFSRSMHTFDVDIQDPIRELQALAKSGNDLSDDDPPFNFQAMLKKTPKNRASMKRYNEMDVFEDKRAAPKYIISPDRQGVPPRYDVPMNTPRTTPYYMSQAPLGAMSPVVESRSQREFIKEDTEYIETDSNKVNSNNDLSNTKDGFKSDASTVTEIAPGITLEGAVADL
ncbi:Neither inactivation nor afterpotential protein C [Papilio machaon]|uniref:non-specific serine/threonine protein kinase n=1 Tax=Papilio machaon TaxID=76193 RepID=A0A194R2X8_PAPMA|nr:Neither inactivation nor afterpotential protein C [Papilio machaon]